MKVKQLIEKLEKADANADVLLYVCEDDGILRDVRISTSLRKEDLPYCQGDSYGEEYFLNKPVVYLLD